MKLTLDGIVKLAEEIDLDVWGRKSPEHLMKHLKEEVGELEDAFRHLSEQPDDPSLQLDVLKEFGDVLFCLVSVSYQYNLGLKEAIALTVTKLQERRKFDVYNVKTIDLKIHEGESNGEGQEE